jgi:hypothetical protein
MATSANQSQHTPGPWALTEPRMGAFNEALMSVVTPGKRYVADIQPTAPQSHRAGNNRIVRRKVFGPEDMANARLIAAAPELLEALVEILGPLNVCSDNPNVRHDASLPIDMTMGELRKARAAIAKARGEG